MPGLVQNFISRRKLQQLILHGSRNRNNAIIIACLWTWITRSWGSQCFEGQCVPGCWALKWVGRWFAMCAEQNTGKKQQHFFATKRVIMKNPARFFHFALDKVRLLSNFQVILSETGSIFGGSGALVVAAGGRGWVPTTDRCFWWVGFTTKQDPL